MKETFTINEVKEILEDAKTKSNMAIDNSENVLAVELDKAWNRGVRHMFNAALIAMYKAAEEAKA